MIGDDIQVELVMIDECRALIGIRAPKEVSIHRQEIYDKNKNLLNRKLKMLKEESR
jgi:carbon storage regulator CsrA